MDQTLVEQIQAVIDALHLADTDAKAMKETMRKLRMSFGLEFNHVHADITQIVAKLRYMLQLATRWEQIARFMRSTLDLPCERCLVSIVARKLASPPAGHRGRVHSSFRLPPSGMISVEACLGNTETRHRSDVRTRQLPYPRYARPKD
jgi:hypothetical protein